MELVSWFWACTQRLIFGTYIGIFYVHGRSIYTFTATYLAVLGRGPNVRSLALNGLYLV
jgi:hypothetical protein